jgi:hypothetical protein
MNQQLCFSVLSLFLFLVIGIVWPSWVRFFLRLKDGYGMDDQVPCRGPKHSKALSLYRKGPQFKAANGVVDPFSLEC